MWRKFTAIVLIILFVAIPFGGRSSLCYASPVALTPAVKYAVAAGLAAGGLYMSDKQGLDYVVQDYWNTLSRESKAQWHQIVEYGCTIGSIAIGSMLSLSIVFGKE